MSSLTNEILKIIEERMNNIATINEELFSGSGTVTTSETPLLTISWNVTSQGDTESKTLITGISTGQTITINIYLDDALICTLKHTAQAGQQAIPFALLHQNLKKGVHKLEVKALVDSGSISASIQTILRW